MTVTADETWRRTLWSVVLVQIALSSGTTIVAPVVPLLLPELGVHDQSEIRLWTGVLLGCTPLVAAFLAPVWGHFTGRIGGRKVLAICAFGVSITVLLMWFARTPWEMLALRIAMGCLGGFAPAGLTLVSHVAPHDRLGYSLGWLSAGQIVGTLIGPVLGGLAADYSGTMRAPFLLTLVIAILAGLLALLVLPRHERAAGVAGEGPHWRQSFALLAASPLLAALLVGILLANAGLRTAEPIVVLQTQALVGDAHAHLATLAGVAVAISGVGNMLAAPFLGRRSDIIGYRKTLLIALAGAAITVLPQAIVGSYMLFIVERFGFGMFIGGVIPTLQALVARSAPPEQRATVFGMSSSANFFGGFLGAVGGGAISAYFGLGAAFVLSACMLAAVWLGVWFIVPRDSGK